MRIKLWTYTANPEAKRAHVIIIYNNRQVVRYKKEITVTSL